MESLSEAPERLCPQVPDVALVATRLPFRAIARVRCVSIAAGVFYTTDGRHPVGARVRVDGQFSIGVEATSGVSAFQRLLHSLGVVEVLANSRHSDYYFAMNKIDLAYLAGVMDSDGSITIDKNTWRVRTLNQSPAYQEMLCISQIHPGAVQLAQELFGGSVSTQKPRGIGRQTMIRWQARNKVAVAAVKALIPFLRIKRRQAEIILLLRGIKDRGRNANTCCTGPHIRTMLPNVAAEMDELWFKIRELNRPSGVLPLSK